MNDKFNIAFISGKLGGVDGVSLEVDKWIEMLTKMGHEVFTIAGSYVNTVKKIKHERQLLVKEIGFKYVDQGRYEKLVFPYLAETPQVVSQDDIKNIVKKLTVKSTKIASVILDHLKKNDIDVIIAENTNAMPMTLLGALAINKLTEDHRVAAIFHHHDFWWERSRFSNNKIEYLLNRIVPPVYPGIEHIVISSYAEHILRSFKRVQPFIVPNCEDFDNPVTLDEYNKTFRTDLGFNEDDIIVLQPTRIVPRKRIEDSIRLVGKLGVRYPDIAPRLRYVVSLYQGDELDDSYVESIKLLARNENVDMLLISNRVASVRGKDKTGSKMYTNRDVLANADIVTMLPIWEGFGNALLETIAAKVPLVTSTYLVYKTDIKITGFLNTEIRDEYVDGKLVIPDKALDEMYAIVTNPQLRKERVEYNFDIGKREFGLNVLEKKLKRVLDDYGDEIRASRKRLEKSKAIYSV